MVNVDLADKPWGRVFILALLLLATATLIGPWAYVYEGSAGLLSMGIAWGVCLLSGLMALGLAALLHRPEQALQRVLAGMLARMGIPLIACMLVYIRGGMLADAGFVYYIMAFYFVTLAVETFLMAGRSPDQPTETPAG